MAGKGRHRSTLGQQFGTHLWRSLVCTSFKLSVSAENPTLSHPGKSAVGGGPVATPRKPLALLDHNTKPTLANKGHRLVDAHLTPTVGKCSVATSFEGVALH